MRRLITAVLLACVATPVLAKTVVVEEVSLDRLRTLMNDGSANSVDITQAYLARIAAMDRKGPALHSVIAVNPDALAQARALDAERKAGHVRGPLHGIPILIKATISRPRIRCRRPRAASLCATT
ncbi:amidase family protein [Sphingomonas sp. H160509]|uniref:amidase family protein n=1 Tax=Sphingomonas sp. H160509 TaxID=2955313 RepID=UPI00406C7F20